MVEKLKFGIAASVIAITITTAGITTVTSFAFVPEAQAFGLNSIKKAAKKTGGFVKKKARITRDALTWETTKSMPGALKEAYSAMGKGAYKGVKRAAKKTAFSARGAGKLAYSDAKRAGRHIGKAADSYNRCLTRGCGRIGNLPRGTRGYNTHDHRR